MIAPLRFEDLPADVQAQARALARLVMDGKCEAAIAPLTDLVAAYPGYVAASVVLGDALRRTGQRDLHQRVLRNAAEILPDDPGVQLGLAFAHLYDNDFVAAAACATRALDRPAYRGEASAILAQTREAEGDTSGAAALYLQAYEARPRIPWLEAHCKLVGTPSRVATEPPLNEWPACPTKRLLLYEAIDAELVEAAHEKGERDPSRMLFAGCEHGTRLTRKWAERLSINVVPLYLALAARGGYCDCEVVLNAAAEDDDQTPFLAARIEGEPTALLAALDGIVESRADDEDDEDDDEEDEEDEEDDGDAGFRPLRCSLREDGLELLADARNEQVTALVNAILRQPNDERKAILLVLYDGGDGACDVVFLGKRGLRIDDYASLRDLFRKVLAADPGHYGKWLFKTAARMRIAFP